MGGGLRKKGYTQKTAQHCKAIILQLKIKIKKKNQTFQCVERREGRGGYKRRKEKLND